MKDIITVKKPKLINPITKHEIQLAPIDISFARQELRIIKAVLEATYKNRDIFAMFLPTQEIQDELKKIITDRNNGYVKQPADVTIEDIKGIIISDVMTEKQFNTIEMLARKKNISKKHLDGIIRRLTGKSGINDSISKQDASRIITELERKI